MSLGGRSGDDSAREHAGAAAPDGPADDLVACPDCGGENRAASRFCDACGSVLRRSCPRCGWEQRPGARFCSGCGAPGVSVIGRGPSTSGERRQLTVLFCDLVGSTQLAAQFDPEDWRDVIAAYQRVVADAVTAAGGHVARFLGDGVMAYFGFPQAHGNDPERAVRAGLAMVRAVQELSARLLTAGRLPAPLQTRLGLDTGAVVVADAGGPADVFGDAPNIASRVQSVAEPDTVCITGATQRLVAGLFLVDDLGHHAMKGVSEPVHVYRAVAPSGVRGRLQAAALHGLPPFVGRDGERSVLGECWQRARRGSGQVALLRGEAGIGKSRLVQQFRDELGPQRHTWIECACSPFYEGTPLHAIAGAFEQAFPGAGGDGGDERERLAALARALQLIGLDVAETVPLVAPLLGLTPPDESLAMPLPPEQQRRKLLAALVRWVIGVARLQPTVMVLEDLHWADPSTLEFLPLLVDQVADAPLLLLCTTRPELPAPWPAREHCIELTLARLEKNETRALVRHVAARVMTRRSEAEPAAERGARSAGLSPALIEAVVDRTDGVPLFVEALTETIVESDAALDAGAIPATLYDTLMARLDRLGEAKEVASVAAVVGREFPYALLRAVTSVGDDALDEALGALAAAELIYPSGSQRERVYVFKHALVRDAAYSCLLKTRRRALHGAIARALESHFADVAAARPEIVANHLTQAGETAAAIAAWQRAGDLTKGRGALAEAEHHYRRAVELLAGMPDTAERAAQELPLQVALGQVLHATRGYGAAATMQAFARARELGTSMGDSGTFLFVILGLCAGALNRGMIRESEALAHQVLEVAESTDAAPALVWGHVVEGISRYHGGDLVGARHHLDAASARYDSADHVATPTDPGVIALSYGAIVACQLGEADTGLRLGDQALALAERLERPYDLAQAHQFAAFRYAFLRDPERTLQHVEPLLQLCAEHQFSLWLATGTICRGWALAAQGRCDDGVDTIREGLKMNVATGAWVGHAFFLGLLAEALLAADRLPEAAAAVDAALAATAEETVYRPDLLRLRAEVLAADPGGAARSQAVIDSVDSAEAAYREAIDAARQAAMRTYELRAATGLARLFAAQGRGADARALLGPLVASFDQGHDTSDVAAARAVLGTLDGNAAAAARV